MTMLAVPRTKTVRVGGVQIGGGKPLALIAGPCVVENDASALSQLSASLNMLSTIIAFVKTPRFKYTRVAWKNFYGSGTVLAY